MNPNRRLSRTKGDEEIDPFDKLPQQYRFGSCESPPTPLGSLLTLMEAQMAKVIPILKKEVDSTYLRKAGSVALWSVSIFMVYVLSLGPALKLSGVNASTGKTALPQWVKVVYYPLFNSGFVPLNNALDRYVQLWIGVK